MNNIFGYQLPGIYAGIQWYKGTKVKIVPRKDGNFSTSIFLGHVGILRDDVWSSSNTAEVHLEDWGGNPESYVVVPVLELEELKIEKMNPHGFHLSIFEPGDVVEIIRTKNCIPAGDCLGKKGVVADRVWSSSTEVLVQLEGELNYRAFCRENVWLIKAVGYAKKQQEMKKEDDTTGTPFKFSMGEQVRIVSSVSYEPTDRIGTIVGRFANYMEHGEPEVIYEVEGPNFIGRPKYKEEELMSQHYYTPGYTAQTSTPEEVSAYWANVEKEYKEKQIEVTDQHKQPGIKKITIGEPTAFTKPGVYIADIPNASFYKEPNTPINIGTPAFEIGDRVKVIKLTALNPVRRYVESLNEFGVVSYVGTGVVSVKLHDTSMNYELSDLKKEFAIGDKVYYRKYSNGVGTVKALHDSFGFYHIEFPGGGVVDTYYGDLEYIPEEKKEEIVDPEALTIKAGGKFILNPGNGTKMGEGMDKVVFVKGNKDAFAITPNSFKMNQPIYCDDIPKRDSNKDVYKYSVKFINAAGDDVTSALPGRELFPEPYRNTSMKKVFEKCYGPQTTYCATIVLASGRVVNIPAPDPKLWDLKATTKIRKITQLWCDDEDYIETEDNLSPLDRWDIHHEEGKCWLKDMARIVNEETKNGPFETKFSYVTEIRKYVRKETKPEVYECANPVLRYLW